MGPNPAVAEIRNAVRGCIQDIAKGDLVLAACSGGQDSLALAAALAFEAPRTGLRGGAVTVDHALQEGSRQRAESVSDILKTLGLDPVLQITVEVATQGGPEAAARTARYEALGVAAAETGATAVLLGHTLDDQAETVLLGLARGSGARSLSGMPPRRGRYRRPLLAVRRATTQAACQAQGLDPWQDPHNADPRFARARVRHQALPALEAALGPGVVEALARTAGQLRADTEFLEKISTQAAERIVVPPPGHDSATAVAVAPLAELPLAIRTRVLRDAAIRAGCPAGALAQSHVQALDALVTGWRGQRWTDLPGGVRALRHDGIVQFIEGEDAGGRERHGIQAERGPDHPGTAACENR
jgi:tRNA(Ile)-lysidine synthase